MEIYNNSKIKKHPFELLFAKENPLFLVVGSFPTTDKKMSFNFFYPNSNNRFWKIMKEVFKNSNTNINIHVSVKDSVEIKKKNESDRKEFCTENKIAITDIINSCIRLNDNSKDEQLLVHKYNNIFQILKEHSSIHTVILTGRTPGTSVHHHFYQYLVQFEHEFYYEASTHKGIMEVNGRKIQIFSLNSTSTRSSKKHDDLLKMYEDILSN